jgi:hypothetical protein
MAGFASDHLDLMPSISESGHQFSQGHGNAVDIGWIRFCDKGDAYRAPKHLHGIGRLGVNLEGSYPYHGGYIMASNFEDMTNPL